MPLWSFEELYVDADARRERVPLVCAGGADRTVLKSLRQACDRGWVAPTLAGRADEIERLARDCGVALDGFRLLDTDEPAVAGAAEVRAGRARLLMKGQIATPALMRAVLDPVVGLRMGRVICQVVLLEVRPAGRRLLMADTGICIAPSLEQKADILRHTVAVAGHLGVTAARVAVMAGTDSVTESMPETLDAAELQRRGEQGEFPGCAVQGPLSFDLAYAADAGDKKKIG
ncbi:MAG TPA: phosphate acyltransferase, partial [Gemmataceae bacterium]|nr:phosphate acyltransferase [Gemmataceae bacterium]